MGKLSRRGFMKAAAAAPVAAGAVLAWPESTRLMILAPLVLWLVR